MCVLLNNGQGEGHHQEESGARACWGVAQVGEQREKDAREGTAFPSCSRKVRERRSCVHFAPAGHVCGSVLSGCCKSPLAASLSHLGCAREGITYPSDSFRRWQERQWCLVEETLPENEELWALPPLAFPSLCCAVPSVMGFSARSGCCPAPQCKSVPGIMVNSAIVDAIYDCTLIRDYNYPPVKHYG